MAKYGDLEFQVLSNEKINHTNTITDKPVEDGKNVGDHIKNNSLKINATVIFSGKDVNSIYEQLVTLKKSRGVYDYTGVFGVYKNMAIENFSTLKDAKHGNGFECTITLKQVRVVKTESIEITLGTDPVTNEQAQGETSENETEEEDSKEDEVDEENAKPTTIRATMDYITGGDEEKSNEEVVDSFSKYGRPTQ